MLQLKFQIDSVLHRETQEPCLPAGVPHTTTTAPTTQKGSFLRGGEMPVWSWFLLKIPSSVTGNCTEALPTWGVLHTGVRAVQPDVRNANYHSFPFTTPPKQHREMERERENYELYKILCNKHSSPPFPTIRSAGGSTILTLSMYVIKRHKAAKRRWIYLQDSAKISITNSH